MVSADIEGLSFALCEATVHGMEFDEERRIFAATLAVLWLPEVGSSPEDLRLQFCFLPVGRLAASLRDGLWNDESAKAVPLTPDALPEVMERFGGNVYGDDFFDAHEKELGIWNGRFSFDWRAADAPTSTHSFHLFQEATNRHLDVLVWFDELRIFRPDYEEVSINWVVEGARRWWTAWNEDDARTKGHGIIRLSKS